MEESEISRFYKGQSILITGASGFLGKVLIWKLLYSCPDIDSIYVLLRPKRGKCVQARLDEMLKTPVFDYFWENDQQMFKKIIPVKGDVACESLDLSAEDEQKVVDNVTIVFHVAATLKLDANLKDAVNLNTEGTWRLLQLACRMKKLTAFVHTSTAFCHCDVQTLEERVYPPPQNPKYLMDLVQWMDRDLLQEITERVISPHPNTYTYSKRLAEKLVADYYPQLPVAIARPSIVIPSLKEPVPGWVDNLNGPVGLMIGAGKGVIRTMLCNKEYNAEVIPVDFAINGLLAIGWKVGTLTEKPAEIPVYNLTQGDKNPMSWGEVVERGKQLAHEYPFEMTLWYPGGDIRTNKFTHNLIAFLCHWIPAYFIDFMMLITGHKRFMVRIQQRIHDGLRVLQYFTMHEWKFLNDKVMDLRECMNKKDKEMFNMNFEAVQPEPYMLDCMLGARKYCMKEDPSTIPRCRRNMKVLFVVDKLTSVMFYVFMLWIAVRIFSTVAEMIDRRLS